jgi:hypothetical protein
MKKVFEEQKVNVRVLLATLWASFMFLYIYVDYFSVYMPGKIEDILNGVVFEFDISRTFLIAALVSVSIPALMIFLSTALPAKISRMTNIVIAAIYIPYSLFNLAGEAWPHMIFGATVEVVLLAMIIRYAKNWPTLQK